jgi:hypothetical protein
MLVLQRYLAVNPSFIRILDPSGCFEYAGRNGFS